MKGISLSHHVGSGGAGLDRMLGTLHWSEEVIVRGILNLYVINKLIFYLKKWRSYLNFVHVNVCKNSYLHIEPD